MIEAVVVGDVEQRLAGAGFGVGCGIDEAGDAGKNNRAGAHRAGFEGYVKGCAG